MNAPDPKELTDKVTAGVRALRMLLGLDPLDTDAVTHYDADLISQASQPKAVFIRKDEKREINVEFIIQGDQVIGATFDLGGLGIQTEGDVTHLGVDNVPIGGAVSVELKPAQTTTQAEEPPNPNVRTPITVNPLS